MLLFDLGITKVLFKFGARSRKTRVLRPDTLRNLGKTFYKAQLTYFTGNFHTVQNKSYYNSLFKTFLIRYKKPRLNFINFFYLRPGRTLFDDSLSISRSIRVGSIKNLGFIISRGRRGLTFKKKKINVRVLIRNRGLLLRSFITYTIRYYLFREKKPYYKAGSVFKLLKRSKKANMKPLKLPCILIRRANLTYTGLRTSTSGLTLIIHKTPVFGSAPETTKLQLPATNAPANYINAYSYFYLSTRHGGSYILLDYGVFSRSNLFNLRKISNIHKIKKKLNSFLEINEYRQYIFSKKRQHFLKKLLFTSGRLTSFLNNWVHSTNPLNRYYRYWNSVLSGGIYRVSRGADYLYPKAFLSLDNLELRIRRIRFKPGYQRLWRNFRLAFADSINYKYTYQKQLTTYVSKFFRKLNQVYLLHNENKIQNVIIYSRLTPDLPTFDVFFRNNLVYLNNYVLSSKALYVYKNDFIQLEISNWSYIFFRWALNSVLVRDKKFKRLIYRKNSAGRYTTMKLRKSKSYYIPKWISDVNYDYLDVKPFLEVDFFTLSVFCIYDYNNILYYSPDDIRIARYGIVRLYNWKYIT